MNKTKMKTRIMRYPIGSLILFLSLFSKPNCDTLDSTVESKRSIILYQDDVAQLICGGVIEAPSSPVMKDQEVVRFTINFDSVFRSETKYGYNSKNISPDLIKSVSRFYEDNLSKMANPTETFNSTDLVRYPGQPFKRLIVSGKSGEYRFAYLEQGGRGYSTVFYLLKGKDHLFKEVIFSKISSVEQLKAYFSRKYQK